MSNKFDYKYEGDKASKNYQPKQENENYPKDPEGRVYYPYLPSPDLVEAVNLAIALNRPLLLEGEPGCGKTRLATAVVYEFTQKYLKNQEKWWPYYIWNVKSTTRARDGLYRYDAVARLRDAQLMGTNPQQLQEFLGADETEKLKERLKSKKKYIELQPLGNALQDHDYRPILLIDEIDKADSDFANDLLLELEDLRFEIPETGETFPTPNNKPIIFITSNREKPLPEPFLRRCLYFFVDFPDEERLKFIVEQRFGEKMNKKDNLAQKAIKRFYEIRNSLENVPGIKQPGTSEFIDFLTALLNKDNVNQALKDLDNLSHKLPLLGTLLKTKNAQESYSKQVGEK